MPATKDGGYELDDDQEIDWTKELKKDGTPEKLSDKKGKHENNGTEGREMRER